MSIVSVWRSRPLDSLKLSPDCDQEAYEPIVLAPSVRFGRVATPPSGPRDTLLRLAVELVQTRLELDLVEFLVGVLVELLLEFLLQLQIVLDLLLVPDVRRVRRVLERVGAAAQIGRRGAGGEVRLLLERLPLLSGVLAGGPVGVQGVEASGSPLCLALLCPLTVP